MRATYSPEDNKLRLYSESRLDPELYQRVRDMGFIWAAKQELFVAPMWTPSRETFLIELCGEIGDEDTSLVDRAEQRSERFEEYSTKRAADASSAAQSVKALADNIPFGQPILVGHHSERRARKDAERIERGMTKAVKMWETSEYWTDRAAGAIAHAKYKEKPAVRARRIKKLQAEQRKHEREVKEATTKLQFWNQDNITLAEAHYFTNYNCFNMPRKAEDSPDFNGKPSAWDCLDRLVHPDKPSSLFVPRTLQEVIDGGRILYPRLIKYAQRWINHYTNRLAYEIAMLNEQGAAALIEKKPRPKQLPLCNYPSDSIVVTAYRDPEILTFVGMTKAEYAALYESYRGTKIDTAKTHRIRVAIIHKDKNGNRFNDYGGKMFAVYLTDMKETRPC